MDTVEYGILCTRSGDEIPESDDKCIGNEKIVVTNLLTEKLKKIKSRNWKLQHEKSISDKTNQDESEIRFKSEDKTIKKKNSKTQVFTDIKLGIAGKRKIAADDNRWSVNCINRNTFEEEDIYLSAFLESLVSTTRCKLLVKRHLIRKSMKSVPRRPITERLGVPEQKRPRRARRNRNRGGINRRLLETQNLGLAGNLARLNENKKLTGRSNPCSAVSLSFSMEYRSPDNDEDGWIRRTHLSERNMRSPLFTGRLLRRGALMMKQDYKGSGESPAEGNPHRKNWNTSRPSISQRLGPRIDSPLSLEHEQSPYHQPLQLEGPTSYWRDYRHGRPYGEDSHDRHEEYSDGRFMSDHFSSHPERPYDYRQPLYDNHSDHYNPGHDNMRETEPRISWSEPLRNYSVYSSEYAEHDRPNHGDYRRSSEEFNSERFARHPPLSPGAERHLSNNGQSLYYPPGYSSPGRDMLDPRSIQPQSHTQMNYFDYPSDYYDDRQNLWPNCPSPQIEGYDSDPPQPQVFRGFRQSLYYPAGGFSPNHDSPMKAQQQRSHPWAEPQQQRPNPWIEPLQQQPNPWVEPQQLRLNPWIKPHQPRPWMDPPQQRSLLNHESMWMSCGQGPSGPGGKSFYQDRYTDEDFTDSDTDVQEPVEEKSKKAMWKTLTKELGILVIRNAESAEMKRVYAEHVKKELMDRATDGTNAFPDNWKPMFLRGGLVHRSGLYQMICKDQQTVCWALRQQDIPPMDGHGFKIIKRPYDWDIGPVTVKAWLPMDTSDPRLALDVENPGICASAWNLISMTVDNGWRMVVADINRESALYLETHGWTLLYWNQVMPVSRMTGVPKIPEVVEDESVEAV